MNRNREYAETALYAMYMLRQPHPSMLRFAVAEGWVDPATLRLTPAGKRHAAENIGLNLATGAPIPGDTMTYPRHRKPRHHYWNDLETQDQLTGIAIAIAGLFILGLFVTIIF